MTHDPGQDRPVARRPLFWRVFGMWPDPRLVDGPTGETAAQRLDRARAWLSSESPQKRAAGLAILGATSPADAREALLNALDDPDKLVRASVFVQSLVHHPPEGYGDRIVAKLDGESRAAERFVHEHWPPGAIESLGLTDRLLPHLEHVSQPVPARRIAAEQPHTCASSVVKQPSRESMPSGTSCQSVRDEGSAPLPS
jgi:hypothetical protein